MFNISIIFLRTYTIAVYYCIFQCERKKGHCQFIAFLVNLQTSREIICVTPILSLGTIIISTYQSLLLHLSDRSSDSHKEILARAYIISTVDEYIEILRVKKIIQYLIE